MELLQFHFELPHRAHDDFGEQRSAVGIEQPIEGSTDAVVVEQRHFVRRQAELRRIEGSSPFLQSVDRSACLQDVAQEESERFGGRQAQAAIVVGDIARQHVVQPEAIHEPIDHWELSERVRAQLQRGIEGLDRSARRVVLDSVHI